MCINQRFIHTLRAGINEADRSARNRRMRSIRYRDVKAIAPLVVMLALPVTALAAVAVPNVPVPSGGAVILNTGSTNTLGYRISVGTKGEAWFVVAGHPVQHSRISRALARKFFAHLRAAMPLSRLGVEQCMKSASFGTSVFVSWRGQRSPDLTCAGDNARARALSDDVNQIAAALHLNGGLQIRTLPTNEPRRFLPTPAPTPSPTRSPY
jgi:hypothetical protein